MQRPHVQRERRLSPWSRLVGYAALSLCASACGDNVTSVTCGAGTALVDRQCLVTVPPPPPPGAAPAPSADGAAPPSTADGSAPTGGTLQVASMTTEYQPGSTVYVNHPLDVTLGFVGRGTGKQNLLVTLGLMEKPAAGATEADLANLKSCVLQAADVAVQGDGSEQYVRFNGVVPPECLAGGPERTFNFQVITDLVEDKTGADPEQKIVVFNEREKDNPLVQGCKLVRSDGSPEIVGCALDLVVKPSPGVNVVLSDARPSTSVIVAYPPQKNPDVPDGRLESPHAAFIIHTEVVAFGQDDDDPSAGTLPAPVTFTYDVRATPDDANVGWMPLVVDEASNPRPIPVIRPREKRDFSGEMHMSEQLRSELMLGGRWFGLERFTIRVCANAPFDEKGGDPGLAGGDSKGDNCRWFPVRLARASTPPTLASAHSADRNYAVHWGSRKAIMVSFQNRSLNQLDLAGASSEQEIELSVDSLFGDFDVFKVWGNASATVEPSNAGLSTGVRLLGAKLFGYSKEASQVEYEKNISFSKEACQEYVFAALIVPVETSFCVGGEAGISLSTELTPTVLTSRVRPYVEIGSSARAAVNLGGFRAGIEGRARILAVNGSRSEGASARLNLAVADRNPLTLNVGLDVAVRLGLATLDADLWLVLETLEPGICKKKILGHKFKYPCVDWDEVESLRIASFDGYGFTQTLLDRSATATLK